MLTPRFKIEQTNETLVITILAPYTNIRKTEISVLEDDVRFFSAPYYLRLNLSAKVEEGTNSSAKYNVESQSFVITLDKMTPGEIFPNLDMLTVMLQPKVDEVVNSAAGIEVLSSSGGEMVDPVQICQNDWFISQNLDEGLIPSNQLLQKYKYGFASRHSGLENKFQVELSEIAEITNPDSLSPKERVLLQEEAEFRRFNEDHYFQDLMCTDLTEVLGFELNISKFIELTDADRDQLKNLKNQEFLLDKTEEISLFLGAADIVFAYLYDLRINTGKSCVESPWNISRLSATLCFFRIFENIDNLVRSCVRRSLAYPLFRNYDLALRVLNDTITIISQNKLAVLKCFLTIRKLFRGKDPFYLQNQLYLDEYCVWIQKTSTENWINLHAALQTSVSKIDKDNIGFDLSLLDIAAKITQEEAMEEEMTQQIAELGINDA